MHGGQVMVQNNTVRGMTNAKITPSDTVEIDQKWANGLWIETGGTLKVTFVDGTVHAYPASAIPDNTELNIAVKLVWATGTAADNIYGIRKQI